MGTILTHNTEYTSPEQKLLCRITFAGIFGSLVYSLLSHTLTHQLCAPVLKYPYVDLTYWLLHLLQIPEFITGHYIVACLFDGALFAFCILSFGYPGKRLFIGLFTLLYFIYFIIFNTYGAHHTGPKIGFLLIPLPFLVANERSFNYLWQSLRYFLLFAYSSAFAWKLLRFSWLYEDQGVLIMKKNLAAYLYFNPSTTQAEVYRWLLQHPAIVNSLFITGFIMEGLFIIGFFTRKYDRFLLLLSVLLPLGFYFMADAAFFELLLLSLTLVNFHRLHFFQDQVQRAT